MAICLFDILQVSTYENCLNKTEIYNFAKYIRNGSAHKNKFSFEGKKIKNNSINWRGKEININLEKKEIFDSFIDATDLILLISDISQMMEKIDKERKEEMKDKQIKKILKTFSINLIE